jgi:DNA-binding IclR family transcriptional regulator
MATRSRDEVEALPEDLESPRAKLVFLYLTTRGEATIEALQDALDLEKITLYSILKTLEKRGLVQKDSGTYRPA